MVMDLKIDHPQFTFCEDISKRTGANDGRHIVNAYFKFDHYEPVPDGIKTITAELREVLASWAAEVEQIREWGGSLILREPHSKLVKTEADDAHIQSIVDLTVKTFREFSPEWTLSDFWRHGDGALSGLSVRMIRLLQEAQ